MEVFYSGPNPAHPTRPTRSPQPNLPAHTVLAVQHALAHLAEVTPSKWLATREIADLVGISKHDRRLTVALELSGWRRHWPRVGSHHPAAWAKPGVKGQRYQRLTPFNQP